MPEPAQDSEPAPSGTIIGDAAKLQSLPTPFMQLSRTISSGEVSEDLQLSWHERPPTSEELVVAIRALALAPRIGQIPEPEAPAIVDRTTPEDWG